MSNDAFRYATLAAIQAVDAISKQIECTPKKEREAFRNLIHGYFMGRVMYDAPGSEEISEVEE